MSGKENYNFLFSCYYNIPVTHGNNYCNFFSFTCHFWWLFSLKVFQNIRPISNTQYLFIWVVLHENVNQRRFAHQTSFETITKVTLHTWLHRTDVHQFTPRTDPSGRQLLQSVNNTVWLFYMCVAVHSYQTTCWQAC